MVWPAVVGEAHATVDAALVEQALSSMFWLGVWFGLLGAIGAWMLIRAVLIVLDDRYGPRVEAWARARAGR